MKKLVFMLIVCIACITSYGQNSNDELLKKLVEKNILTQSEADEIKQESEPKEEKKNSFEETTKKIREAFNTPYMTFGGYGQFLYRYTDAGDIRHNAEPRTMFLSMSGELVPNLKYLIFADFVNPMLYEYYMEWTPSTSFNIRGGQMKTPLSIENQFSASALDAILNTRSISSLTGMAADVLTPRRTNSSGGRDIGVRVAGKLCNDFFDYAVGLYQGAGLNTSENNNSKDFAGSLYIQPFKGFRVGGSAYFGEANYSTDNIEPILSHVRNRWVLSTEYDSNRFYARAEWLHGNDGGIKREGLYGTATWYFTNKLHALAKVDYYNQDKEINSEVVDYTVGLTYWFYKRCRLQLNYTYSDFNSNWDANNSNVVLGQLQVVF